MELDYQLGEDIKEKLIPRAIDWFTGEALAFEEIDEDELDEDEFDDDDDEDDDLSEDRDDEEESEEDDVSLLLRSPLYFKANSMQDDASKPKQEAAECKQS